MKKKLLSIFTIVTIAICMFAFSASAASTVDVTIYGTYNYDYANKVLELINEERAAAGEAPLTMDPNLTEYAMQRAAEISVYYNRDHKRPDGTACRTVITDSRYNQGLSGENIALGQTAPSTVMTSWMNSSGHKANILNSSYQSVGVGCFRQDNGEYCWVQIFYAKDLGLGYSKSGKDNRTNIPIKISTDNIELYISGISGGDTHITNSANSGVAASLFYGRTTPITLKLKNTGDLTLDIKTSLSGGYSFSSGNSSVVAVSGSNFVPKAKGTTTMNFALGSYGGSFPIGVFSEVTLNVEGVYAQTSQKVKFSWDNSSGAANLLLYQDVNATDNVWYEYTNVGSTASPGVTVTIYPGESNKYRVFTLVNSSTGKVFPVSEPVTVTGVSTPEATVGNVVSTGKTKISWNKVDGAEKYIIHRIKVNPKSTDTDRYTTITYITSTSYIDKTAEFGKEYDYQVVAVNAYNCQSGYSSKVRGMAILGAPTPKATNIASTGKIKLTWDAVDGASKYDVYRATSKNGSYTKTYTTTKTAYINTSAQAGVKYYYKIQAVHSNDELTSKLSAAVIRSCDLPRPEVTIGNVKSTGKIKLSWNAVPGAAKYEVYRSTSKTGSYTKMYTTTNTSYINTSAKVGTLYYYKVKAIHSSNSSANSAYSALKSRRCDLERPVVSIGNVSSSGKIKLSWPAIDGASKYEIYRSTSKSGTYKLYKTTTNTSFTNTSTTAGTTYYYKVKAIHSNSSANSAYSEIKSRTCDLPRPVVTVKYTSDGKPKLTWEAVDGAVKYEIYRSETKDGTYTKAGTASGTSVVHTRAVSGKTYYYKVKAIHSKSSANSGYSLIVSATAK